MNRDRPIKSEQCDQYQKYMLTLDKMAKDQDIPTVLRYTSRILSSQIHSVHYYTCVSNKSTTTL